MLGGRPRPGPGVRPRGVGGPALAAGWRNPLQYGAREYDAETGLYSQRARYYDPRLRRFVSRDPVGLAGGANEYAYAGGDPVNLTDPSGLSPTCVLVPEYFSTSTVVNGVLRTVGYTRYKYVCVGGGGAGGAPGSAGPAGPAGPAGSNPYTTTGAASGGAQQGGLTPAQRDRIVYAARNRMTPEARAMVLRLLQGGKISARSLVTLNARRVAALTSPLRGTMQIAEAAFGYDIGDFAFLLAHEAQHTTQLFIWPGSREADVDAFACANTWGRSSYFAGAYRRTLGPCGSGMP